MSKGTVRGAVGRLSRMRIGALIALCFLGALMAPLLAHAQSAEPLRFDLAPSGNDAARVVTFRNTSDRQVTLEIIPERITAIEGGSEVKTGADGDFLIFPPTTVLAAGEAQRFSVQYVGESNLPTSRTYRIYIRDVSVNLGGENTVQVNTGFGLLVSVVPEGAKPNLRVIEASSSAGGELAVTVENAGNKYVRLIASQWDVGGQAVSGGDIAQRSGNLILPGTTRTLTVPANGAQSASQVRVVSYE